MARTSWEVIPIDDFFKSVRKLDGHDQWLMIHYLSTWKQCPKHLVKKLEEHEYEMCVKGYITFGIAHDGLGNTTFEITLKQDLKKKKIILIGVRNVKRPRIGRSRS